MIKDHFRDGLVTVFEQNMINYTADELDHITESLSGLNVFNLTDRPLSDEITTWINKGSKFNPAVMKPLHRYMNQFDETFIDCTNKILKRSIYGKTAIHSNSSVHQDLNLLKKNPRVSKLVISLQSSYQKKRKHFKNHIRRILHCKPASNMIQEMELRGIFNLDDKRIIVESDKKLGFTILDESVYLEAYSKINVEQHFHQAHVTEDWYLENIQKYIENAKDSLPTELKNIVKTKDFEINIETPRIGALRLLPKIQKLKVVDHTSIGQLKCRGIKSSLHDPIQVIQRILDKIFSHLLYYIELQFNTEFNRHSPSVSGVNEALERMKSIKSGRWGQSVQFDADFSNMYSNVGRDLLMRHVKRASQYAGNHQLHRQLSRCQYGIFIFL